MAKTIKRKNTNNSVNMTISKANAHNAMTPNNAFMIGIGTEENPEFLYPEELEPAVVKAFNSSEEYNEYYGEQFGKQVAEGMNNTAPHILEATMLPFTISGALETPMLIYQGIKDAPLLIKGAKSLITKGKKAFGKKVFNMVDDMNGYVKEGSHFRIVDKPAIDDAINSGVIRSKTGLYHGTPEFLRTNFSKYLDDIHGWESMDANTLKELLENKGAFNGMSDSERKIVKFKIGNSTNHGGTVGYFKDMPYPNYNISNSNYVIETPESIGSFVAGHGGKEFVDIPLNRAGATLLKTNGSVKGASIPSKGSSYWKYSPFWEMWKKKKFAIGGIDNNAKSNTLKVKYGGMKENKVFKLKGGVAIPLDDKKKLFYLSGAKHEQGGIDVTPELEAEGGEVVKVNPKSIKVVTAQKIMGGKSPAELVVDASSTGKSDAVFNKVFNYQEEFKDRVGLNDDGTRKAKFGKFIKDGYNKFIEWLSSDSKIDNIQKGGNMKKKAVLGLKDVSDKSKTILTNVENKAIQLNPNMTLAPRREFDVTGSDFNSPLTGYDWANIGVNALGSLLTFGHALGNAKVNPLRYSDPIPYTGAKLKTRVNINSAKQKIKRATNKINDSINKNTSNSTVALNRLRNAYLNERDALVDLYTNKENIENQLINKDILNWQSARFKTITDYNAVRRENEKNKYLAERETQENINNAISGFVQNIGDATSSIANTLEKRDQFDKNMKILGLAYPNLDVERLNKVIRPTNTKKSEKDRKREKVRLIRKGIIKPSDI